MGLVAERLDGFLPGIVGSLGMALELPHTPVITEGQMGAGEDERRIYYIGKGECKVTVKSDRGRQIQCGELLREGAHFGEI